MTGIIAAIAVLFFYNPTEVSFYPRCPSKLITGYDCPGCGSLRGLHALLHGDFAAAWSYNPAIFFAIILTAMIALAGLARDPGKPADKPTRTGRRSKLAQSLPPWLANLSRATARITDHPAFPATILVATIAWTVLRNC